jgi:hypothetical protein
MYLPREIKIVWSWKFIQLLLLIYHPFSVYDYWPMTQARWSQETSKILFYRIAAITCCLDCSVGDIDIQNWSCFPVALLRILLNLFWIFLAGSKFRVRSYWRAPDGRWTIPSIRRAHSYSLDFSVKGLGQVESTANWLIDRWEKFCVCEKQSNTVPTQSLGTRERTLWKKRVAKL